MTRRVVAALGCFLLAACGASGGGGSAAPSAAPSVSSIRSTTPEALTLTTLDALASEQPDSQAYHAFVVTDSMEAGIYRLAAGDPDTQGAHRRDELYVILEGAGTLEIDGSPHAVKPGSMVYVRAGVDHRFVDAADGMRILVVFANAATSGADPAWRVFDRDTLAAASDGSRNVWARFLKASTMTAGLYLLPSNVGGDRPQTHGTDELNLVFDGQSGFSVDGGAPASVGPGSLFVVPSGHGHAFTDVTADVEELIVWPAAPG